MKLTFAATAFAAFFATTVAQAEVTCTPQQILPSFKKADAHWKIVEKLDLSLSTSWRDLHNAAPPNSPTAISTLLFDEKVGVLKGDKRRKLWIVDTSPRAVSITPQMVNLLKDDFEKAYENSPEQMRALMLELKAGNYQNVAEVDAKMVREKTREEAPFLLTFRLEEKLRASKNCGEFTKTLDSYFEALGKLVALQAAHFGGTRSALNAIPFEGNEIGMTESLAEVCVKQGSKFGEFNLATRQLGVRERDLTAWEKRFLASSTTNWQDQWSLTIGMVNKMLIGSPNRAAVKAVVQYDRSVKGQATTEVTAKVAELCPAFIQAETQAIESFKAIDRAMENYLKQK